ncbi:MAG TPA: sulfotransferase [Gemmataceae bacterium]|nr:sulfotransferase [Gemmataceae bacterium]
MSAAPLTDWVPIRLYWIESGPMVDWCRLGDRRFREPFFEQTIEACLRLPFNQLFRRQTPIQTLLDWHARQPGVAPTGFIFHMSRCGSTLVSQMLAALPENIVLSEAGPINQALRAHGRDPRVIDDDRRAWLTAMIGALAQRRRGDERRLFIKFDSWHILELSLIRQAFPDVPWVFLYRNPVEVLVSQIRHRGAQMVPTMLEPAAAGVDLAAALAMKPEEYCARFLANLCQAALQHHAQSGMLVEYRDLPDAVCTSIAEFFHLPLSAVQIQQMREAARFNAKTPQLFFEDDTVEKNRAATDLIREMTQRWLQPLYDRLEQARQLSLASATR